MLNERHSYFNQYMLSAIRNSSNVTITEPEQQEAKGSKIVRFESLGLKQNIPEG